MQCYPYFAAEKEIGNVVYAAHSFAFFTFVLQRMGNLKEIEYVRPNQSSYS